MSFKKLHCWEKFFKVTIDDKWLPMTYYPLSISRIIYYPLSISSTICISDPFTNPTDTLQMKEMEAQGAP